MSTSNSTETLQVSHLTLQGEVTYDVQQTTVWEQMTYSSDSLTSLCDQEDAVQQMEGKTLPVLTSQESEGADTSYLKDSCQESSLNQNSSRVQAEYHDSVKGNIDKLKQTERMRYRKSLLESSCQDVASGFLEDYVEVCGEQQGLVLESTVDEAVLITVPVNAPRKQKHVLDNKQALSCNYRCNYCDYVNEDRVTVEDHVRKSHPKEPLKLRVQLGSIAKPLRRCPFCEMYLEPNAFFQHMRATHTEAHPFKCGYCNFMGRDVNQVKHHLGKKHPNEPFKCINLVRMRDRQQLRNDSTWPGQSGKPPADDQYNYNDEDDTHTASGEEEADPSRPLPALVCPICQRPLKTLHYLKAHMKLHRQQRFKCGYCGYLAVHAHYVEKHSLAKHKLMDVNVVKCDLDPVSNSVVATDIDRHLQQIYSRCCRQPRDPDPRKWQRKYNCPHCSYTCNYGASFRRHVRLHKNQFPYRCKYCDYKGREKYYIRRHIQRIHQGLPVAVVENISEKSPIITSSADEEEDEDTMHPIGSYRQKRRQRQPVGTSEIGSLDEVIAEDSSSGFLKDTSEDIHQTDVRISEDSHQTDVRIPRLHSDFVVPSQVENYPVSETSCDRFVLEEQEENPNFRSNSINVHIHLSSGDVTDTVPSNNCNERLTEEVTDSGIGKEVENEARMVVVRIKMEASENIEVGAKDQCSFLSDSGDQQHRMLVDKASNVFTEVEVSKDAPLMGAARSPTDKNNTIKGHSNDFWRKHNVRDYVITKYAGYTTCICGVRTVNNAFYKHAKKHINIKPYRCGYCLKYCSIERAKIRTHTAFMHPGLPVRLIDDRESAQQPKGPREAVCCPLCKEVFPEDWPSVLAHMTRHYNFSPYRCGSCKKTGASLESLYNHWQEEHPGSSAVVEETEEKIPSDMAWMIEKLSALWGVSHPPRRKESTQRAGVYPFCCPMCQKVMSCNSSNLRRHLYKHFHYRPYNCGYCEYKGLSTSEVIQHTVSHGDGVLPKIVLSKQPVIEGLEDLVSLCIKSCRTGKTVTLVSDTESPLTRNPDLVVDNS